ncbi:ORF6N domain-containing protein [Fibrobacter sp. UWT3]|uniref:ORF6N domain-containing protein n=1 Tax=Fibrobacter sp. UWT3 TaxID=1896225 RepID=UPI000BD3FCD3|nr:ORF6N domain-containing protein [Fibrobacter sp. UWT3]SOE53142.1 ORF6N domain-containing protein [Fibrobacter sp. UWT3]
MDKNKEKMGIATANPLVESGVGKMIQVIRGKQVLLDRDLATLYGVETKRINEQVKRNIERFPEDFCIQLSLEESQLLRSQNATIEKKGQNLKGKHTKYRSLAFTEQGVAMLSSVLKSESAIRVNIAIMRASVQLRHIMMGNGGLVNRLSNVEAKLLDQDRKNVEYDRKFDEVFEAMDRGELKSKGLYYNNQEFDAYVFVCALIRQAKKRIVLVDRYVTEKTLTMMLKREKGVSVTIYTYDKSKVLDVDLATYNEQYPDSPMQVLPSYGMHDRFLFIDDTAYHFGASLKDLGKNTFFFTQEDFTLDEVLKESQKIRAEKESQTLQSDNAD